METYDQKVYTQSIIYGMFLLLSSVCMPVLQKQPNTSHCRQSDHLPNCPSFHLFLAVLTVPSTLSSPLLSIRLPVQLSVPPWLCWQLLGLMPSQCSAPSWPMERRLLSQSRRTGYLPFLLTHSHISLKGVGFNVFFSYLSPSFSKIDHVDARSWQKVWLTRFTMFARDFPTTISDLHNTLSVIIAISGTAKSILPRTVCTSASISLAWPSHAYGLFIRKIYIEWVFFYVFTFLLCWFSSLFVYVAFELSV